MVHFRFEFAIPMLPFEPMMVSAESVVVAVPATVVVARYKLPPAFLKAHCAIPAPAERASCEPVVDAMVRLYTGVVVPIPKAPEAELQKNWVLLFVPKSTDDDAKSE